MSPGKILWYCRLVDSTSEFTGKILGSLILVITAIFCWEVLLRSVFNSPTRWAHESTQYFFAVHFLLGGAYALKRGDMVNVDVLVKRLKPRTRAIIDGVTGIVTLLFLVVLIGKGFDLSLVSIARVEISQTPWGPPIYPLKITLVVGALLLCLQALAKFIRDIIFSISGKAWT